VGSCGPPCATDDAGEGTELGAEAGTLQPGGHEPSSAGASSWRNQEQAPDAGGCRPALCEHAFAVAPPYPVIRRRLDRALAARDLEGVRAAARELPGGLSLADALAVLVVMDELEDPRFERAAVRFVSRFAAECGGVGLGDVQAALQALDALPAPDAHATLVALLKRHANDRDRR
jgi:hypothetical protein